MSRMDTDTKSTPSSSENISSKIFLGFQITPELRLHLNGSDSWKRQKTLSSQANDSLKEVHHNDKEFIGRFLAKENPALEDLQQEMKSVHSELVLHCEELCTSSLTSAVFPQIFLS